jgi:hypothetical protein
LHFTKLRSKPHTASNLALNPAALRTCHPTSQGSEVRHILHFNRGIPSVSIQKFVLLGTCTPVMSESLLPHSLKFNRDIPKVLIRSDADPFALVLKANPDLFGVGDIVKGNVIVGPVRCLYDKSDAHCLLQRD